MYGNKEFSRESISLFGEDVLFLVDDQDLLHPQMGFLASAIEEGSSRTPEILEFIEGLLARDDLHPEIENAVVISFVELERFRELNVSIPPRIKQTLQKWQGNAT